MNYRRNTDSHLRDMERQYATTADKILLRQIDAERRRSGLPPHATTRIEVATDRLRESHFQCFQILRDIRTYLDQLFEISQGVRILSDIINERQYIPEVAQIIEMRQSAETDLMATLGGAPPSKKWVQFLKKQSIELPPQGSLPPAETPASSTLKALAQRSQHLDLMPQLRRPGAPERLRIASDFREKADDSCHEMLKELVTLGLINAADLLEVLGNDEEETVAELLLSIENALGLHDLTQEELFLAHLGQDPTPEYQSEVGDRHWWRHIG